MAPSPARGFLLQPTQRIRDGVPVVELWGRLEDGAPFVVEEQRFRPYCFVPEEQAGALRHEAALDVQPTGLRDLAGRPMLRIEVGLPGVVPALRERLERAGCEVLEADIRFPYRFLIDRGIGAGLAIDGPAQTGRGGLRRFRDPELAPAALQPELRTLSLDIETSPDASRLYSIAFVCGDVEEVHLVGTRAVTGAVVHEGERGLLAAFVERVAALDPDLLTGWNVIDFDLRVLARRAHALGVPLDLGQVPGSVGFLQDAGFSRQSRAEIPGRVVLDGIPLVRDALRLEDYRLETVARAVLGRGKRIDSGAPDKAAEITRMYRQDPEALVAYNLEDARLVPEILEREGLLALCVERSLLSGMPLDRVSASIASFDRLYLPELRRRGVVAPSVDPERKSALVKGGALLEPQPGLHRAVAVYDFKSLYPSLMRTFQLDPLAHARAEEDRRAGIPVVEAPNGALFSTGEAILPEILERFLVRRQQARERGDTHAVQAIKIMMNALFGVLGAASCRFFDPDIANAITSFGQQTLHWTREAFEAEGVAVLYGDTDSVFVKLARDAPGAEAWAAADALRARVASRIEARVRDRYGVESRLELELERVYDRLFLPRVRGGRSGSKKRYAGLVDGRLRLVGLESVRRDWPAITGRLQEGMLERLFGDRDVMPFVREVAERLDRGELDAELVYVKRVRKSSLERYTASTPPHVKAARKAGTRPGGVVRYVITARGPEPVPSGGPIPEDVDRHHYLEKVIRPVADSILVEVGHSFDEAMGEPRQLRLL